MSDVDLFGVGDAGDYRMVVTNKVNLAVYDRAEALRRSSLGDLFILHIVREGRTIYDESHFFRDLSTSFKFRVSYRTEIDQAIELGWSLLKVEKKVKNWHLLNKRMAWCVRTILIAQAAEGRKAIFSVRELSQFGGSESVGQIIGNKDSSERPRISLELFERFLEQMSGSCAPRDFPNSLPALLVRFEKSGNIVGEKTIRALMGERESNSYT
jgi:hypothetical protein